MIGRTGGRGRTKRNWMPLSSFGGSTSSSALWRNMNVAKDFEEFLESCNKHAVEYLVVGGYAFALHAHPRYTGDLDVFVRPSNDNAQRIINALADFGFEIAPLTWKDFAVDGRVVQLGFPPLRIDIMTSIDGVAFEEAWERKVESRYGSQKVYFISRGHLIANKRASGRKQDLLDLESLEDSSP